MKRRNFLMTFLAGAAAAVIGRQAAAEPPKDWDALARNAEEHLQAQFDGVALNSVAHPGAGGDWYLSADIAEDAGCTAISLCRIHEGIIYVEAVNVITDEDAEDDLPHTRWWRQYQGQSDAVLYEMNQLPYEEAMRVLELMREAEASDQRELSERSLEVLSVNIRERRRLTGDKLSLIPDRGRAIGRGPDGTMVWL